MCTAQTYANSACHSSNADEVLECRFRHYYLNQTTAPAEWYHRFKQEVYKLLGSVFGLSEDEIEYRLRSFRFVSFANKLLALPVVQVPVKPTFRKINGHRH